MVKNSHVSADIQAIFEQATRAHQAKQWEKAADCYQQVIEIDPNHTDSLHLLSLVCAEQKQFSKALDWIQHAIALQPDHPIFYCNQAQMYCRVQQCNQAINSYQCALQRAPQRIETYTALADVYLQINQPQTAALYYLHACYLDPHQPVTTHHQLGNAFLYQHQWDAAACTYQKALSINPQSVETLCNLGVVFAEQNQYQQACMYYQQALAINPEYGDATINFGLALSELNDFVGAEAAYQKALQLLPQRASTIHSHRGLNAQAQDHHLLTLQYFNQALQADPKNAQAQFNRAITLLSSGDWRAGWEDYEQRFALNDPNHPRLNTTKPLWQQQSLIDEKVFVYSEQGLGDTWQCVRYLPLLKQQGAHIILRPQPHVLSYLKTQPQLGIRTLLSEQDHLPDFDYHIPLMSLPHRFQTTPTTILSSESYLTIPQTSDRPILDRESKRYHIGLVWTGNPKHKNNLKRSLPLEQLKPVIQKHSDEIQFYSLQCPALPEAVQAAGLTEQLHNLTPHIHTWIDTAQLMDQLDLVITVDTGVAHFSAALGKPTWILLPFLADFRWLTDRIDTPWYQSARLFRQLQPENWQAVVETIDDALSEWMRQPV